MKKVAYDDAVFINCPFDEEYAPILRAIIFTVMRCGFIPRSALEEDNGLHYRLEKIQRIIKGCRYGIHDISRTELNGNGLPRFNMPFELGFFFGAQRYGNKLQQSKSIVIFDTSRYRYQQFISDINGVDIKEHQKSPTIVIQKLRNWLATTTGRKPLVGHTTIIQEYNELQVKMPEILSGLGFDDATITFNDYCLIVEEQLSKALTQN